MELRLFYVSTLCGTWRGTLEGSFFIKLHLFLSFLSSEIEKTHKPKPQDVISCVFVFP